MLVIVKFDSSFRENQQEESQQEGRLLASLPKKFFFVQWNLRRNLATTFCMTTDLLNDTTGGANCFILGQDYRVIYDICLAVKATDVYKERQQKHHGKIRQITMKPPFSQLSALLDKARPAMYCILHHFINCASHCGSVEQLVLRVASSRGINPLVSFHSENVEDLMSRPERDYVPPDLPFEAIIHKSSNHFMVDRIKWDFF